MCGGIDRTTNNMANLPAVYFMTTVILILINCATPMHIVKQGESLPIYMESREKLLAREKTQRTGGQIVLNSKEQKVR